MHIHGGKLYGIRTIGQILYEMFLDLNGLNPSVADGAVMMMPENLIVCSK
jgi:hypothetical protein